MKISKYTFLFDVNEINYFTYNTLSNALIEIDKQIYSDLKKNEGRAELSDITFDKELCDILFEYLQPIINQYFVNNKSEIWLWSLMIHSKGHRFNGFINS